MPSFRYALIVSFVLTLLVGSFLSCSDPVSSPPESEPASSIRPLTIGNQWFGTRERYGQAGMIETYHSTATVVGDTTVSDTLWFEIFHETDDTSQFAFTWSSYLRDDSVGQWEAMSFAHPATLLAKYPANALDSFPLYVGAFDTIVPLVVTSIDTILTVPAGEFSCYNYSYTILANWDDTITVSYWFSPGVGMIKTETYGKQSAMDTATYLEYLWELDSFDLVMPDSNIIM